MKLAFFAVPALAAAEAEGEVNRFLAAHRVVSIDRQLVALANGAWWALCVTYLDGAEPAALKRGKVDYKEVLSEPDFALYARLRSLRKELADREGVPAYALFTNEQLAAMAVQRIRTAPDLGALPGVGAARVERYGPAFLALIQDAEDAREPAEAENG